MFGDLDVTKKVEIHYDYNSEKSEKFGGNYSKGPKFNGDQANFAWWKYKIYPHIIDEDECLWDIIEEGVSFQDKLDEDGQTITTVKKTFTTEQKKEWKRHNKAIYILASCIIHDEFLKFGNRSSAKGIYDSLYATYEGN